MQNLKQMEDYKKDKISKAAQGDDLNTPDVSADTDMGMDPEVDSTDEFPADMPATDTFSAEDPAHLEVEANAPRPYMVITNLKKIADQANQLIGMVQASGKVEQWAVDHITTSADDVEEVFNYYKYKD
jgi:hypothetical protein